LVEPKSRQGQHRRRNIGSTIAFAALAVVLIAIAVYTYTKDDDDEPSTAPPPNVSSRLELVNIRDALVAEGLNAEYGRSTAKATGLTNPGQAITVGTATLYVYIYDNPNERAAESDSLDPDNLVLTSVGTPVAGGASGIAPRVFIRSNVVAILAGGDAATQEKVAAAFDALPDATPLATIVDPGPHSCRAVAMQPQSAAVDPRSIQPA
jgi:hypothetical protein